jgi:hypothetical protein
VRSLATLVLLCGSANAASWHGVLHDGTGRPIARCTVSVRHEPEFQLGPTTNAKGQFQFKDLSAGSYIVTVGCQDRANSLALEIPPVESYAGSLELTDTNGLSLRASKPVEAVATGGERLSSDTVAGLRCWQRELKTDTNGAANFTQQFAVSGQRRTAAVFAMDGIDTSDPELGGATFSNFNVDAIEEIRA